MTSHCALQAPATLRDKFCIPMLRIYYSELGVSHEVSRSSVSGHKTSVSLEDTFWSALKEIAKARNVTLSALVAATDSEREHENLSSTIRLFLAWRLSQAAFRPKRGAHSGINFGTAA